MNSKERFQFHKTIFKDLKAEDIVRNLVNNLIKALYIPVIGWNGIDKIDQKRIQHFKIDDSEPINWGALECIEVKEFKNESYLVIIDEAEPKACPTFCEYLEIMMKSYGWNIKVETEW